MLRHLRHICTLIILTASAVGFSAFSQEYRFEAGIGAGIGGYLGDVNQSNIIKHPGYAAELSFKYLINKRFAAKASLSTAHIKGNSEDFKMVFPEGKTYSFSHPYYEVAAAFEFNFFNFGIGSPYQKLNRITPYLSLGIGVAYAPESKAFSPVIPIGAGAKYKLTNRINLGLELRAKMMLGDKIDGLSDLRGIKSSAMKNTDWCPTLMVSIAYEFGEICKTCHYVD